MKLSAYARKPGISYRTAWRWFKAGKLAGYQTETGTIIFLRPVVRPTAYCGVAKR
jgi:predicted site-specific integrase-resolvase